MVKVIRSVGPILLMLFSGCLVSAQQADYKKLVEGYVQQFKDVAIKEMKEYHIPASITLAQGILESNAGRSPLAVEANNHFGIKCHKEWTGMTYYKDDETRNECFRKYNSPLESFRDHSWFLTQRDRYKGLFKLDVTDYKGWATGLKSAGYATNPAYAQLLIKTIETFVLDRFDKVDFASAIADTINGLNIPEKHAGLRNFQFVYRGEGNRDIYQNNGLRMIISREGDNLFTIAGDFNISVEKLIKYNDLQHATAFKPGQIVYLEHKRRKGNADFHKLQTGESLYSISQLYGIKLKLIYKRNDLQKGAEAKNGTVLRLR
jgi:hypothetical protein